MNSAAGDDHHASHSATVDSDQWANGAGVVTSVATSASSGCWLAVVAQEAFAGAAWSSSQRLVARAGAVSAAPGRFVHRSRFLLLQLRWAAWTLPGDEVPPAETGTR